jgi:hypothetical protein
MRKLIDFINDGNIEFGKKYYLSDFDSNDLRNYFIFYDDEFYTGYTTHENNVEVDQEVLQVKKGSINFEKFTNKTWKVKYKNSNSIRNSSFNTMCLYDY